MAVARVVLDTDVVIDFLRGHGSGVDGVRRMVGEGRALVSAITVYELRQGALTPEDLASVELFCRSRTLSFTLQGAVRAGDLAAELRVSGTPIGTADTLIAGLCLHHGCGLMTKNTRHFSRVPSLELVPAS